MQHLLRIYRANKTVQPTPPAVRKTGSQCCRNRSRRCSGITPRKPRRFAKGTCLRAGAAFKWPTHSIAGTATPRKIGAGSGPFARKTSQTREQARHHIDESLVQKAVRGAAPQAGPTKRATSHTFRHSLSAHLLEGGYDIRTVQEL